MRDPGIEIAKKIILAGPKKVIIYDPNISKISDLTSNFYISIEDVKNENRRDKACIEKLSLLNPYILTEVIRDNNLIEHLEKNSKIKYSIYDVVLISEFISEEEIKKIIVFVEKIISDLYILWNWVFMDFVL